MMSQSRSAAGHANAAARDLSGAARHAAYAAGQAAVVAHVLRLNKVVTLIASNISIPPMMPFILFGALALGHWIFTGERLNLDPADMTRAKALDYLWHWAVGSVLLGAIVGGLGGLVTYVLARIFKARAHRQPPPPAPAG